MIVACAIFGELEDVVANEEAHQTVEGNLDEKNYIHIDLCVQSF